ncbi:Glycosyl transferase, family 2 [Prochlorococcus marinus str. MIT 9515]|uniref:Glycosyl transferase, family 2 n=2 Tax=Prochlorococcus marinus TaxID=1219 RepID=A2BW11_PROM5|nr:Glycosyl transferase, family 2 [Prochlorococcus marinus str. MIT 9515]
MNMENAINIQFIIPTYNEEHNINSLFDTLSIMKKEVEKQYLSDKFNWSLLVADNASNDKTLETLDFNGKKFENLEILPFYKNYGFSFSTSYLLHKSSGDICILIPADGQIPIEIVIRGIVNSIDSNTNTLFVRAPETKSNYLGINIINNFKKLFYLMINKFNEETPKGFFGMGVYLGNSLKPVRELPKGFVPFQIRTVLPSLLEDYSILKFRELDRSQGKSGFNLSSYANEALSILIRSEYISRYAVKFIILSIFFLLFAGSLIVFLIKLFIPGAIIPGFTSIILLVLTSSMLNIISIYFIAIRLEKILLMPSNYSPRIKKIK